jgi:Protein of unknown function (DUF1064).
VRKHKYNIDISEEGKLLRTYLGITFDSLKEKEFYIYLLEQQKNGLIKNIILQPKFLLQEAYKKYGRNIRKIEYIADFEVEYINGEIIIYDVKAVGTSASANDFKIKRKLFDYKYSDKVLKCVNYSKIDGDENNNGWCDIEAIERGKKQRKKAKLINVKGN